MGQSASTGCPCNLICFKMKIRIQGNAIRLRLSQREVRAFGETGLVEERIQFGSGLEDALVYALVRTHDGPMNADFTGNRIRVMVPAGDAAAWVSTDQVGMAGDMNLGNGNTLHILVEKDFKCLTDRAGEDESDNFPNPNLGC